MRARRRRRGRWSVRGSDPRASGVFFLYLPVVVRVLLGCCACVLFCFVVCVCVSFLCFYCLAEGDEGAARTAIILAFSLARLWRHYFLSKQKKPYKITNRVYWTRLY